MEKEIEFNVELVSAEETEKKDVKENISKDIEQTPEEDAENSEDPVEREIFENANGGSEASDSFEGAPEGFIGEEVFNMDDILFRKK